VRNYFVCQSKFGVTQKLLEGILNRYLNQTILK